MSADRPSGIVETVMEMFSPLAGVAKELQLALRLERSLWCRSEHGRLEILMRGGLMTEAPLVERISLAQRLTNTVRPILGAHRKRELRRLADRAIAVVFEDEQVVDDAVATSRFTYLASHDFDEAEQGRRRKKR